MDLRNFLEDLECRRGVRVGYFEHTHRAHSLQHAPNDHPRLGFRRITFNRSSENTTHRRVHQQKSLNPVLPSAAGPTSSSSPSQRIKAAFAKPHALRALSVYILTKIFILAFHIAFGSVPKTTSRGGDHFGVFVKSRYLLFILGSSTDLPSHLGNTLII